VPIFGKASARACSARPKLIGKKGVVYAIYVLPVPSQLSLDAGLERRSARSPVLESARIQARRAGIKIHTGLIRKPSTPAHSASRGKPSVSRDDLYEMRA